ncbi:MAG TPA: hypothetical protein DHW42_07555 [Candidatus Marinimicrobia bacterium]|nr:hypothetical protein [Candidatus Neomarinimicrobiota bacterium]
MGHIKREDLSNSMVIDPGEDELKKKDEVVSPMITKIITNNKELITLQQLRDTLLPKLMSGKVRVKDIQEEI